MTMPKGINLPVGVLRRTKGYSIEKTEGVYEVRMNLSSQVPDCQNKRVKLGKSGQRITNLWNSDDKAEWEAALAEYWNYIKPGNLALEKRLNHLNVKKPSDISDWYSFLLNEYIPWKYTAPLYLRNTKDWFTKEYAENHKKLNDIIEELFKFDRNDIRRALDVAGGIKGFGVGGASGLLSLLFPEQFGTVDQFVVKALQKITAFPAGEINSSDIEALRQMKPENLSKSDGIILIRIMRTKADNLNLIFGCRNWTPSKIDMVLWALGHDK